MCKCWIILFLLLCAVKAILYIYIHKPTCIWILNPTVKWSTSASLWLLTFLNCTLKGRQWETSLTPLAPQKSHLHEPLYLAGSCFTGHIRIHSAWLRHACNVLSELAVVCAAKHWCLYKHDCPCQVCGTRVIQSWHSVIPDMPKNNFKMAVPQFTFVLNSIRD